MLKDKLPCEECENENARSYYNFRTSANTTISRKDICEDCRILLLRRAPAWFPNVKTIQQELSEINELFTYLKKRNVKREPNYEAIFFWIKYEEWPPLKNYTDNIGAEVNHALREEILEFIEELKKIPEEYVDDWTVVDERNIIIGALKKKETQIRGGDNGLTNIDEVRRTLDKHKNLLTKLQYYKKRAGLKSINRAHEVQPLKGVVVFMSGKLYGLEEERIAIAKLLEDWGAIVNRFEMVATKQNPSDQCRDWAMSCDLYLGIYGGIYGEITENGLSPTEIEFNEAKKGGKDIIIFIKKEQMEEEQTSFIKRIRDWKKGVIAPYYQNHDDLIAKVMNSLENLFTERFVKKRFQ